MILSGGLGQLKLCAPKGGAQLRNKFLGGVGVVAESARQVSPESVRVSRPVSVLLSAPVPGEAASGLGSACRETMVRRHARPAGRARASANRTGGRGPSATVRRRRVTRHRRRCRGVVSAGPSRRGGHSSATRARGWRGSLGCLLLPKFSRRSWPVVLGRLTPMTGEGTGKAIWPRRRRRRWRDLVRGKLRSTRRSISKTSGRPGQTATKQSRMRL